MIDFINLIFGNSTIFYSLIVGVFVSVISGVIGTFISLKNISYVSGGISHAILGGVGIAYFFGFSEYYGSLIFALIFAGIISTIHFYGKENENVLIGALWSFGMSLGIIFMYLTPGYNADLSTYIFGSIVLITKMDVVNILILFFIIILFSYLFYRQFIAIAFDAENAKVNGVKVEFIYTLLIFLISLSVVVLIQVTGLIMVVAFLTLPVAISRMWLSGIFRIMVFSTVLCFMSVLFGFYFSFSFNLPVGASTVFFISNLYFLSVVFRILKKY